jgi:fatty acid elongase 3
MMSLLNAVATLYKYEDTLLSWVPFFIVVPIYLLLVFGGSYLMRNVKPLNVQPLLAAHNIVLCVFSIVAAIGSLIEVILAISTFGLEDTYCSGLGTGRPNVFFSGRIWFWGFVFYLSKYYKLIDTLFIVVKRRPLTFLHVYHHIVIIALCLGFMRSRMTFYLNGVITNATIHTFMYYYYWQQTLGKNVWWKKYLTTAQIIQFFWGLFSFLPYQYVCNDPFALDRPVVRQWWANQLVMISFILLFSHFYQNTYKEKSVVTDVKESSRPSVKKD